MNVPIVDDAVGSLVGAGQRLQDAALLNDMCDAMSRRSRSRLGYVGRVALR